MFTGQMADALQLLWRPVLLIRRSAQIRRGFGTRHLHPSSRSGHQDIVRMQLAGEIAGTDYCSSSPDLIVHGILDEQRPLNDIKADLKGIMERLVSFSISCPTMVADGPLSMSLLSVLG